MVQNHTDDSQFYDHCIKVGVLFYSKQKEYSLTLSGQKQLIVCLI